MAAIVTPEILAEAEQHRATSWRHYRAGHGDAKPTDDLEFYIDGILRRNAREAFLAERYAEPMAEMHPINAEFLLSGKWTRD